MLDLSSQAELNMKESQAVDLRKNITLQQSETSNAKSELKAALEVSEKLKTDFNTQRASSETENALFSRELKMLKKLLNQ